MARRRASAATAAVSDSGWVEYDVTRTVSDVEVDLESAEPIQMPVRPPTAEERRPKTGDASPVFDLTEGVSSQPSSLRAAAASTTRVTNTRLLPHSAVGKLIAHFSGGYGSGSAFVVGNRTVFTAAHCIDDNPSRVEFIPNVGPGDPNPSRRWAVKYSYIHRGYLATPSRDLRFDFAVCVTDPADDPVMPVTGNLGWLTVPHGLPDCTAIGYPSDPPRAGEFGFDGIQMWQSRGPFLRSDAADLQGARNDMTRGCSGGPWVVDLGFAGGWRAVGLNSHVRSFNDRIMWSPVFDDDFVRMIRAVRDKESELNGTTPSGDPEYIRLL